MQLHEQLPAMFFRIHLVKQLENLFLGMLRRYRHIRQQRHITLTNQIIETHILIIHLHQQVLRPGGVVDPEDLCGMTPSRRGSSHATRRLPCGRIDGVEALWRRGDAVAAT